MAIFLMMLTLSPINWGLTWIYASPLHQLDRYLWLKLVVRIALAAALLGFLGVQLNFLAKQQLSLHAREVYVLAWLTLEALPLLGIIFYRYYQNPNSYWSGWKR